jgi:hypothetical protein
VPWRSRHHLPRKLCKCLPNYTTTPRYHENRFHLTPPVKMNTFFIWGTITWRLNEIATFCSVWQGQIMNLLLSETYAASKLGINEKTLYIPITWHSPCVRKVAQRMVSGQYLPYETKKSSHRGSRTECQNNDYNKSVKLSCASNKRQWAPAWRWLLAWLILTTAVRTSNLTPYMMRFQ